MNALIWIAVIVSIYFVLKQFDPKKEKKSKPQQPTHLPYLNDNGEPMPEQLLDLDTTTLADRQRAYHRGPRKQMRYDILQRRAELAGDTVTLEALRTNTYDGPLPELEDDSPKRRFKIKVESGPSPGVTKKLKFFCIKDKGYHVSVWPNVDGYVDLDYVEFNIAGITHHREAAMNHLGEAMGILVAEPDNPYDANAIRIMTPDWQCVGYVPQDRTDEIREHTKLPCPCLFYIGAREKNGDLIFYTDAYIRLDMLNNK